MKHGDIADEILELSDREFLGGNNFLVSAVMILRRQKKELADENLRLKAQLDHLQNHNAALVNVSADRLLGKMN